MSISEGLRIISVAKSLEGFQRGDSNISRYFGVTLLAGHVGLFLSSLRKHRKMKLKKFKVLAANAHIEGPLLNTTVIPWMKKGGFIELDTHDDNANVICNVIDYNAILISTSQIFRESYPTPEECAVLGIVDLGIQIPQTKSDIFEHSEFGDEETITRSLNLAKAYKVIRILEGYGIENPVIYSPMIWGDKISKAGKALSHIDANRRTILLELIHMVRQYQGMPLEQAQNWGKKQGDTELINFAVHIGLLDRTVITVAGGQKRIFLTTPHIYGEIAATQGKDVCDRVRLFLDSIRHGQHYGQWYTGRIADPIKLLNKLIDAGEIGPCTAIGRDYQLVERGGIVNVRPSVSKADQFIMKIVQEDTVSMVRNIIEKKVVAPELYDASASACGQDNFISAEEMRARLGEPPQKVREAEQEMLRKLREM